MEVSREGVFIFFHVHLAPWDAPGGLVDRNTGDRFYHSVDIGAHAGAANRDAFILFKGPAPSYPCNVFKTSFSYPALVFV